MQAQPQPGATRAWPQRRVDGQGQLPHGPGQQGFQGDLLEVLRPDGRAVGGPGVRRAEPGRPGRQLPQPGQVARLRAGQDDPPGQPAGSGRVARPVVRVVLREIRPRELPPRALVGGVAQPQFTQVHPQVVVEELGARGPREFLPPGAQQDLVRLPARLRAGPPVDDAGSVQRDRQPLGGPAHVPDVDPVRDQGDPRVGGQHAGGEDDVLVREAALGEADAVLAQEAGAVELVDAERVVDQARPPRRVRYDGVQRVEARLPGDFAPRGQFPAYAQPARDLRARPRGRREQRVDRARGQDVVAVQEHDVRGGHRVEPGVARGAAAAAVDPAPDHLQAGLRRGEPVEQPGGAVRRAVVDGHDLAHGRALGERRAHGVRHMRGVVVADDHDGDLKGRHHGIHRGIHHGGS